MKKFLLASVALSAIVAAAPAVAADMSYPVKAPVVAVIPAFSWTGFYIGGNIGYAVGQDAGWPNYSESGDYLDQGTEYEDFDIETEEYLSRYDYTEIDNWSDTFSVEDQKGFFGGGQIGYNYQFSNNVVLGVEADFQFASIKGSGGGAYQSSDYYQDDYYSWDDEDWIYQDSFAELYNEWGSVSLDSKIEWFGTVRARLGYAFDRFMPYITGGLAYGQNKVSVQGGGGWSEVEDTYLEPGEPDLTVDPDNVYGGRWGYTTTSQKQTYFGWTIGAGFEYALTDNWTVKAEYLYVDLGSKTYNFNWVETGDGYNGAYTTAGTESFSVEQKFHTAKIGVNYKF